MLRSQHVCTHAETRLGDNTSIECLAKMSTAGSHESSCLTHFTLYHWSASRKGDLLCWKSRLMLRCFSRMKHGGNICFMHRTVSKSHRINVDDIAAYGLQVGRFCMEGEESPSVQIQLLKCRSTCADHSSQKICFQWPVVVRRFWNQIDRARVVTESEKCRIHVP